MFTNIVVEMGEAVEIVEGVDEFEIDNGVLFLYRDEGVIAIFAQGRWSHAYVESADTSIEVE